MYAFIKGVVVSTTGNEVVVENGGIGYLINVSQNTMVKLVIGKEAKLFTQLYVKEDIFALYGFVSQEEKKFFERLLTISGIGPKMALQVLSGFDINSLAVCIASGDVKSLSKIKGVGKKTAERIILELRGQLVEEVSSLDEVGGFSAGNDDITYAIGVLVSLGVSKSEALTVINSVKGKSANLEEMISLALRQIK